jgi:hypothetical protein
MPSNGKWEVSGRGLCHATGLFMRRLRPHTTVLHGSLEDEAIFYRYAQPLSYILESILKAA